MGAVIDRTACLECGTRQRLPNLSGGATLICATCRSVLQRATPRSLVPALACSAATLLLLAPANLAQFLRTSILGASRQSVLASSAQAMLEDGWPILALVVLLTVVILPVLRFGLLTLVLALLQTNVRPRGLGRAFRWTLALQTWAMQDVFLLAFVVAYERLRAAITVEIGIGAYCFIAAAILSLFTRALLNREEVWRRIGPDPTPPPHGEPAVACLACEALLPAAYDGQRCPRCAAAVTLRKPQSMARTAALGIAALLLYFPANLYPLATLPIGLIPTRYTVLQGVIDLGAAQLWGLALLVFTASFAIPFLKIAGLSWLVISVLRRSAKRLVFKTRLYGVIEEIGRWSMIDPFVICCFTPVMHYNALIYGRAEAAAVPFTAVVLLTTLASKTFDPRRIWDAAGVHR
jgi:paraquat-inducible protein A